MPGWSRAQSPGQWRVSQSRIWVRRSQATWLSLGPAQNLLHRLDLGIDLQAERLGETVGEHLHGVTQPFAGDADLVQLGVTAQVSGGPLLQVLAQAGQQRPGQVLESGTLGAVQRSAQGGNQVGDQALELGQLVLADRFDRPQQPGGRRRSR